MHKYAVVNSLGSNVVLWLLFMLVIRDTRGYFKKVLARNVSQAPVSELESLCTARSREDNQ